MCIIVQCFGIITDHVSINMTKFGNNKLEFRNPIYSELTYSRIKNSFELLMDLG